MTEEENEDVDAEKKEERDGADRAPRTIQERMTDDYTSVDGFKLPEKDIPDEKAEKLYTRDSIVHREIYKELEDIFGRKPEIVTPEDDEDNELKEGIEELLYGEKTRLFKKFERAAQGAFLNGMALIYMNYDGDKDIHKSPSTVEEVVQCGVIFKKDIHDYNLDKDITSDTFNEVKSWLVDVEKGTESEDAWKDVGVKGSDNTDGKYKTEVHADRLLHVKFDSLFNDPWGLSRVGPEFDAHISRKIVVESAVSAFYQNAEGIRGFTLPKEATQTERELLANEIKSLNKSSDMMLPHDTEVKHPGPNLADPSDLIDHLMETSTAMPYQILTGTQAGAVTGSETNLLVYYLEIDKMRRGKVDEMLKEKIDFLQGLGALPDGKYDLDWGSVIPANSVEEAGILAKLGVAVNRLIDKEIISQEEGREIINRVANIEGVDLD